MFNLGFNVLFFVSESEGKVIVTSLLQPFIWDISVVYIGDLNALSYLKHYLSFVDENLFIE